MEGGDRRFILDEVLEEGRNNYAHATLGVDLVEKRRGIKGLIYELYVLKTSDGMIGT